MEEEGAGAGAVAGAGAAEDDVEMREGAAAGLELTVVERRGWAARGRAREVEAAAVVVIVGGGGERTCWGG